MPVPTKTNVNDIYEKTIEEYIKNKYRVVNQSDSSTELEMPHGYTIQVIVVFAALINFLFVNWIVGGLCVIIALFGFMFRSMNKGNRIFVSILNGNVKTTGYTLEKLKKHKKTTKILTIVIVALILCITILPWLVLFVFRFMTGFY